MKRGRKCEGALRGTLEVTEINKRWSYIENRRNDQITKLMKNKIDYQTINATVNI